MVSRDGRPEARLFGEDALGKCAYATERNVLTRAVRIVASTDFEAQSNDPEARSKNLKCAIQPLQGAREHFQSTTEYLQRALE